MNNFVVAMLTAFVTAIITWFGTNYYGRNLLRFWDLRLEAHKSIFVSASSEIYKLAIEIEGLRVILPKPVLCYLHIRGYELHGASQALVELSGSLRRNDGQGTRFRVKAQEYLKLPVDPNDQGVADAYRRLESASPEFYDP
jgi:hypothetical protein